MNQHDLTGVYESLAGAATGALAGLMTAAVILGGRLCLT